MSEPSQFGNFVILRSLAAGGMGEIFLAKRTGPEGFEKILVLKKMLPHLMRDQRSVTMFLNEAKLAAQLDNPNVVQIYDFGKVDNTYYIAMEYIHGKNLRDLLDRTRRRETFIPFRHSLFITGCVLAGLDYAHKKVSYDGKPLDIIHRDISPQNILVSYDGTVKLTDFGIAKAATLDSETTFGTIKGKLSYMSPEQVNGEPLDQRTDVFSLGIVLYEMLTGRRLFPDETGFTNVIDRIRKADIPMPRDVNPSIPEELEDILLTSLAKHPNERFQEAREMASAITQFVRQQGFTSGAFELAAYVRNQFPEEDLSQVLATEETMLAPGGSWERGSPEGPTRSAGPSVPGPARGGFRISRRVLLGMAVGLGLVFALALALPALFTGAFRGEPPAPTPVAEVPVGETRPVPSPAAVLTQAPSPPRLPVAPVPTPAEKTAALVPISTSPAGASIWMDGQPVPEKTNATLRIPFGGTHQIRVEKPGYEPRNWEVKVAEGEDSQSLYAPLQPRPTALSIETDPPGATVRAAGRECTSPCSLADLAPKRYSVEAVLAGYDPHSEMIEVKAGERNAFTMRLRKTAETAQLTVDTAPWTKVSLDGRPLGDTPLDHVLVPTGSHTLRFENPEFKLDQSETVQIKPGHNVVPPRRFLGTLQFDVALVSEFQIGKVRYKQGRVSLPVGAYTVSYTDPRGAPKEVMVTIRNGEATAVR